MLVLALAAATSAHAAELTWEGFYRGRGLIFDSLSLSTTNEYAEGTSHYFDHRLLLKPSFLASEHASVHAQLDVFQLLQFGAQPDTYVDPVSGEQRAVPEVDGVATPGVGLAAVRAWAEGYTPYGRFSIGRMPMQWGSGILWNDGTATDAEHGDSADRIAFSTRVGPVFGMLAWDVHYEGLLAGDDDMQAASLALGYRTETAGIGLLNNYRYRDAEPSTWQGYTGDLWAFAELGPMRVELEGVGIFAGGDLDEDTNDVTVMSFGVMARGRYTASKFWIGAEFGAASGDEDNSDSAIHTFSFDRDHNVGILLFEESMPTLEAPVANDANGGRTYDAVLTGDGIGNAIYFRPEVRYRIVPEVEAGLAWLTATEAQGQDEHETTAGGYGNEFDLVVRADPYPHVFAELTVACFLPGPYYTSETDPDLGGGFNATTWGGRVLAGVEF